MQSSTASNTLSPQMRQQSAQQAEEIQAKIEDSKAQAATMEDETAKWQMGNRNWLGGGHQFRDNAAKSLEGVSQQIAEMSQQPNLTPDQQMKLQSLKRQQSDFGQLVSLHSREAGYSGVGAFGDYMRNSVKTKKQKMIEIGQQIRNATAQNDSAKAQQLKSEWDHLDNTLQTYRSWNGQ
jgi:hypothetical protein